MKKFLSIAVSALLAVSTIFTCGTKASAATVPSNANLLNTYGNVIPKVGTACVSSEILDSSILQYAKKEYNSMTVGNEMKPDYILGWSPKLISISEAKAKGYYIPDNYPENTVPELNFSTVDQILKTCYDNGLSLRGHTLVWHSQTPDWYFKTGYNKNSSYVSQAVMNKRMEFYIKTYMGHVCSSKYSSVVYAWDVVNEFLHAKNSGWQSIYGNPSTNTQFVKDAFNYAYDTLAYYKMTDKVKLFYNDFNTYMEVNDVISLINFINSGRKVCAGIGMQSHLGTNFPTVAYYKAALDAFRKAGFEIQITELDVGCTDLNTQAKYYYDLMTAILEEKKAGANITALVWWGLCDNDSWRHDEKPLLYSDFTTKKAAYNSVLQAYFDAGYTLKGDTSTSTTTTVPGNNASLKDGWYYIKNINAQKYLQVKDNTGKAGQNVELSTGTGCQGQKWYLKNLGNGYVTLKSALGEFMIDVASAENKDGANIQIYNGYSGDAQQFAIKTTSTDGAYVIATKCSNLTKVLDDYNFGKTDGTNVCQWSYGGKNNQLWVFEPTTSGTTTSTDKLSLSYNINNWGSAYQVNFKITNNSNSDVNTWTLKLKKSDINITTSWNVNIKEDSDYYYITPVEWNSKITKGSSLEIGVQGSGSIGSTINYALY